MGRAPQTTQTLRSLQVLPEATAAPEPSLVSPKHRKTCYNKEVCSNYITESKSEKKNACCEQLLKTPDLSVAN